jgi:hypothetical protein
MAKAGQTGDLVTISLSGSTAMRNFTTSAGFSYLTPGTSIELNSGPGGTPVMYTAPNAGTTQFQLAPSPFPATGSDVNALRVEWHEQGSVEGILELAYFQAGSFSGGAPSFNGGGNPVWVNRNRFTAPGHGERIRPWRFRDAHRSEPGADGHQRCPCRQGFSKTGTGTFLNAPASAGTGKATRSWREARSAAWASPVPVNSFSRKRAEPARRQQWHRRLEHRRR